MKNILQKLFLENKYRLIIILVLSGFLIYEVGYRFGKLLFQLNNN